MNDEKKTSVDESVGESVGEDDGASDDLLLPWVSP